MNEYLRTKIKVVSFFLVVLVVIVHAYNISGTTDPSGLYAISGINGFIQDFICQGLNRIASPLFFIISGYLFYVNLTAKVADFTRKVKKRFKTLIIPYLFWSLWGLLVYFLLQSVLPPSITFSRGIIREYSFGELMNAIFLDPIPYQLWYVRDLTVFAVLSPIFFILLRYLKGYLVIFFLFTWFYEFNYVIFRNQSVFFFIFGAFISHLDSGFMNKKSKAGAVIFTALWLLITAVKTTLIFNNCQSLILITVLHKISIVAGILSINSLYNNLLPDFQKITGHPLFKYVTFSFFLFASHEPVCTIVKKGLLKTAGSGDLQMFLVFLVTPVITILICVFAGYYLKKMLPRFYGTITGWR